MRYRTAQLRADQYLEYQKFEVMTFAQTGNEVYMAGFTNGRKDKSISRFYNRRDLIRIRYVYNTGNQDDWGNPIYKDIHTNEIYLDVNWGENGIIALHTVTSEGEADYPIKNYVLVCKPLKALQMNLQKKQI